MRNRSEAERLLRKASALDVVIIHWTDATGGSDTWIEASEQALDVAHVTSVGFLAKRSDEGVSIIQSFNDIGSIDHYLTVPWGMVNKAAVLADYSEADAA